MKKTIEKLTEAAKEKIKKDGELFPIGIIVKDGVPISIRSFSFNDSRDKAKEIFTAGMVGRVLGADGLILINDVTMKSVDKADFDKKTGKITKEEVKNCKGNVVDAVAVIYFSFDGKEQYSSLTPYKKNGDEIEFEESSVSSDEMGGMFSEYLQNGWSVCGKMLEENPNLHNELGMLYRNVSNGFDQIFNPSMN